MNSYRVSFYKNLCNSDGHSFKCLQRQVDVQSLGSSEALMLAERLVDNERLGADCIEIMHLGDHEVEHAAGPTTHPLQAHVEPRRGMS